MLDQEEVTRSQQAREVFEYWVKVFGKTKAWLDAKRSATIVARLREGMTVDDLKMAIRGCRCSRWHMGENERHKKYCDLELILRDAKHVEQFCEFAEQYDEQRRVREAAKEAYGEKGTIPEWVKSEMQRFKVVAK